MRTINGIHNDLTNKIEVDISHILDENIDLFEALFKDCNDIVKKKFQIGEKDKTWGYIAYVDSMINREVVEDAVLEQIITEVKEVPKNNTDRNNLLDYIKNYAVSTADIKEISTFDEVCISVMSGDTIMLIDGFNVGLRIATRGWPNRGVQEPDTEGVVRGAKEGFSEALRINTVLIRRRIRDTKLKVKQQQIGTRSRTDIALVYIEDIVRPQILEEIENRLKDYTIDAVLESGMLEELMERDWHSPFPRAQVTQRPDKAAAAILEGRVAIIVDNTPFVLLLPITINNLFHAAEDHYQSWVFSSFVRSLRYISAFFAIALPGLYIAVTCFHTAMIPPELVYSISAARNGVPFPTIIEVLIIELEFEFLREAGVRLPGSLGNTISIVGGLIIGQAAVEANIVSPIIIVIVAITAIASFSIPSYSLTNTYRILKYGVILASGLFGLYGFWISMLVILTHLVSLKSLNIPYLMPFVSDDINEYNDLKDTFFRLPITYYNKRPFFAARDSRVRLKINEKDQGGV